MIESKRLPREMVLKQSRIEESRERLRIDRECRRLAGEVQGIKGTMAKVRKKRNEVLREAHSLNAEAKRLANRSLFRTKLGLLLNAVGTVISGGSAFAAKRIIGDAINTIGSIVGFSSLEKQIIKKLEDARGKMNIFERQMGHLSHLEEGMGRINKTRKKLRCFR
ncbi:MAG: hypothetical protein IH901_08190 [Proteobacteria bacterium]|nr:hypothetical protein [Pseudomonadota bacterium]